MYSDTGGEVESRSSKQFLRNEYTVSQSGETRIVCALRQAQGQELESLSWSNLLSQCGRNYSVCVKIFATY